MLFVGFELPSLPAVILDYYCHCLAAASINFCTSVLLQAVGSLQQELQGAALPSCLEDFSRRIGFAEGGEQEGLRQQWQ